MTTRSDSSLLPAGARRAVAIWLLAVCVIIVALVAVGGITRLTESGLSMVKWEPLLGAIPPIGAADWARKFQEYRQYPEYRLLKPDMTLEEFKVIFFWEYLHRLLARLSGLAFLFPYLAFLVTRRLNRALACKLAVAFVLGGLQGLMGWFMVTSGLADKPYVSHLRLAAHLSLALLLLAYLVWILAGLFPSQDTARPASRRLFLPAAGLAMLFALQILYGALVAGLNAGYMFNSFPLMMGRWLPPGMGTLEPGWLNLIHNGTTVQFIHRHLGVLVFLLTWVFWWKAKAHAPAMGRAWTCARVLLALTALQVGLGILTLLLRVPVAMAVLHQLTACGLVATLTVLLASLSSARQ